MEDRAGLNSSRSDAVAGIGGGSGRGPGDPPLEAFTTALADLRSRGRLRARAALPGLPGKWVERGGRRCLNLASNNYLDLADHPAVKRAAADAALAHGAGAGGSRLLGGGLPLHRELEEEVASLRPLGGALLFNTGFMANLGALQALAPLAGPVFSDRLNHASAAEALRLVPGSFHRYRHADMSHLEALLDRHAGGTAGPGLVVTETLFSMDGDEAPLDALLDMQRRRGFLLYLDEAHSTGCRPDLLERAMREAPPGRLLAMGTFGKAYGGFGAYVAGPEALIEYMVNAARAFIFSTALPPAVLGAALAALRVAEAEPWRREKLAENAARARELFLSRGFDVGRSRSHILPVLVGTDAAAATFSEALYHEGFHAPPVRPPTVPEGTARLRINLTCALETENLTALAEALERARDAGAVPDKVPDAAPDTARGDDHG